MSTTPKTDEAISSAYVGLMVPANFARKLEAALDAAKIEAQQKDAEINRLTGLLADIANEVRAFPTGPRPYSSDSYLPESFHSRIRKELLGCTQG